MSTCEKDNITADERRTLRAQIDNFLTSQESEIKLGGLSSQARAFLHKYAVKLGLKSRSHGSSEQRVLTISRVTSSSIAPIHLEESGILTLFMESNARNIEHYIGITDYFLHTDAGTQYKQYVDIVPEALIPPPPRRISLQLKRERDSLPIHQTHFDILHLLDNNQVLILKSATGSGKSTQVPQYLLENATQNGKPIRIMVTQPRRIAAINVAARIAKERGEALGETVGYQIHMEKNCSKETVCTMTTSGYFRRLLTCNKDEYFRKSTHLIIDEVHERDLDTDFILLAVKMALTKNMNLKVILMSATMDLPALSTYFNNAPVLDVGERSFNVQTYQLEEVLTMTGYTTPEMTFELELDRDPLSAYRVSNSPLAIDYNLIVSIIDMLLKMGQKGAVIVYLPGYFDIVNIADRLKDAFKRESIRVLTLHSQMDNGDESVFRVYPDIKLKVVLSTNIGQTSITIPDLIYVIDTGKSKVTTYEPNVDASQLAVQWISKADAKQRTGRAGRCQEGICYRLYSTKEYDEMDDYTVPEILRSSLDDTCLQIKIFAPSEPIACTLLKALQPPTEAAIEQACKNLKQFNLLANNNEPVESISELGKIVAMLPLDVQFGKCLIYSLYYGCFNSMSIITSFFSIHDPFVISKEKNNRNLQKSKRSKHGLKHNSDVLGILMLYDDFNEVFHNRKLAAKFCEEECLSFNNMNMFMAAVKNIRKTMSRHFLIGPSMTYYDRDCNMIHLALMEGFYNKIAYFEKKLRNVLVGENDSTMQISKNSFLANAGTPIHKWILYIEKSISTLTLYPVVGYLSCISPLIVALKYGKKCVLELDEEFAHITLDDWITVQLDKKVGAPFLKLRELIDSEFTIFLKNRLQKKDYHNQAPRLLQALLLLSN